MFKSIQMFPIIQTPSIINYLCTVHVHPFHNTTLSSSTQDYTILKHPGTKNHEAKNHEIKSQSKNLFHI